MRCAVLSDIHANLPALEAVLADIDQRQIDALYCLGDLVGYATWPNEVIHEIRYRHVPTIAGNYDIGIGSGSDDCGCAYQSESEKERGVLSIAYTNEVVSDTSRAYLRSLPRHLALTFGQETSRYTLLLVHGSPRRVNEYLFEDRPDRSLLRILDHASADVLLFGHTHIPYHRVLEDEVDGQTRYRHAINTGSVGKPKDGDPRACYLILELADEPDSTRPDSVHVTFVRVSYDVERAARAIEQSPLPNQYAQMLRDGG